jgi:hypothetical protein
MKQIINIDAILNTFPTWKPSDIAFITRVEWSIGFLEMTVYSQLRNKLDSWPDATKEAIEITLIFRNVSNVKLELSGTGPQQIMGFDIHDISDRKLEKINYEIEDYEDGFISLYCEEIEILEVRTQLKLLGMVSQTSISSSELC